MVIHLSSPVFYLIKYKYLKGKNEKVEKYLTVNISSASPISRYDASIFLYLGNDTFSPLMVLNVGTLKKELKE